MEGLGSEERAGGGVEGSKGMGEECRRTMQLSRAWGRR